jgi:hypothetical protein
LQHFLLAIILRFSFINCLFNSGSSTSADGVNNIMIKVIICMYLGMLRRVDQEIITDPSTDSNTSTFSFKDSRSSVLANFPGDFKVQPL